MLVEYENPIIGGHVVLVVGSRSNKRRSIAKAILDLRTSKKLVDIVNK
jgi:hypothetical protein